MCNNILIIYDGVWGYKSVAHRRTQLSLVYSLFYFPAPPPVRPGEVFMIGFVPGPLGLLGLLWLRPIAWSGSWSVRSMVRWTSHAWHQQYIIRFKKVSLYCCARTMNHAHPKGYLKWPNFTLRVRRLGMRMGLDRPVCYLTPIGH